MLAQKGKAPRFCSFTPPSKIRFLSLDLCLQVLKHHNTSSTSKHTDNTHTQANMSREAYQVPTNAPVPGRDSFQTGTSIEGPAINYLCGDCNAKVPLKRGDPIRCKECGHRVLYKERTKREVDGHVGGAR